MKTCTQCDTPAFVIYEDQPLCIRHHLMFQQASWIQYAQLASTYNAIAHDMAQATGGIIQHEYITLPPPPSMGEQFTLNRINVTGSNVGMINTGTIRQFQHLDASITAFETRNNRELAESLRSFTQLLWDSDLDPQTKDEIAEQVAYLAAQAQAELGERSKGTVKSVFRGIKETVSTFGSLAQSWSTLQPLLEQVIQV